MNDVRKSAIAKLAKMGLTEEEVLALCLRMKKRLSLQRTVNPLVTKVNYGNSS